VADWNKVEELFHAALARPLSERSEFLKNACDDEQLRQEVQRLLENADPADEFLEGSPLSSQATVARLAAGKMMGRFRIVELIGAGGMGEVYRAHDDQLRRDVAVKVLPAAFAQDAERMRRFEQEARSAGMLNHPNIMVIYDLGIQEGSPYLVSELLEGESLRKRLAQGALPPRKAIGYARQVASGLAAAHHKGVIHRDLKPENIFLTRGGQAKILDFGLAKLSRQVATERATATMQTAAGVVMGTVGYMSPEQLRGEAVDQRSDLFSLGAILYEMLVGQRAFGGKTSADIISATLRAEPPELSEVNPEIPPRLRQIVGHCLAKRPEERFESARDLEFVLDTISGPESESPKQVTTSRRIILTVSGSAVLAAAAGVAVDRWLMPGSKVTGSRGQRTLSRLTFEAGLQSEPTWSPDGSLIAYSSNRGGKFDVWVQPYGEGEPAQVTKSPGHNWQPDWSPDGKQIVFRSERQGGGLYVIPALGGNERKISPFGYRPSWSPDGGTILFDTQVASIGGPPKVFLAALDGSAPREILADFFQDFITLAPTHIAWHPSGRQISVVSTHKKIGRGFWTVPIEGGAAVKSEIAPEVESQLREAGVTIGKFAWSRAGSTLYFEGSSHGASNLWKITADPKTLRWISGPERLTVGPGRDAGIKLSPDGKKLAFTVRKEDTRVWVLPFDAVNARILGDGKPASPEEAPADVAQLSPDGRKLIYFTSQPARQELWETSLDSGARKLLLPADGYLRNYPCWSRDGRKLAYRRSRPGKQGVGTEISIVVLPADGGDEQVITTAGMSDGPRDWFGDGKRLLAITTRPDGKRWKIWEVPLAGAPHAESQARVIASDPDHNFYVPQLSPDDRWIGCIKVKADEPGLSAVCVAPAAGGEITQVTSGKFYDDKVRWSPDGRTIYFLAPRDGCFNVWGIRFDPVRGKSVGEPFRVTSFENPSRMATPSTRASEMSVAANRLALPLTEVSGSLWVLENLEA